MFLLAVLFVGVSCRESVQVRRDRFYKSAQTYLSEGKLEDAMIQYRNAVQLDDRHVPSIFGLGKVLQKKGDHRPAIAAFRRTLELDSSHTEAKLELGTYFLVAGLENPAQFGEAKRMAEEVLKAHPDNLRARILLGNAYAGRSDFTKSIDEMKTVLEQEPENLFAMVNLGVYHMKLNDPKTAEKSFLAAVTQHPKSPEARRAIAAFYASTGQPEKAEVQFRRALELAPKESVNLHGLVHFYISRREFDKAENVLQEAATRFPDWKEPVSTLSSLYQAQGKEDESLRLLLRLAEKDPMDRSVQLKIVEMHLAKKRLEEAKKILDQYGKARPADPAVAYLRGRLLLEQKNDEEAVKQFNRSIELDRNYAPAYKQKALLHLRRFEFADARTSLTNVLRIQPRDAHARGMMAKLLVMTGRPREALEEAQAVLRAAPGNGDARFAEAEALLLMGRVDESRALFEKLKEANPENPVCLHRLGRIALMSRDFKTAAEYFRQALRMAPGLTDVARDYVAVFALQGQFSAAQAAADELAKGMPPDFIAVLKGQMYLSENRYGEAEEQFRKAIAARADNYQGYLLLGETKRLQNQLPEALREVDKLIQKDQRFAPGFMLKAYYLETAGDTKGAIAHYSKALELAPDNPLAANNLAWIYCQRGENLEQALTLARKAREQMPANGHIADTLGWIYYRMNNYILAVDQLSFAVNNGRQEPENYYRLGMALYRRGDKLRAKQSFRKALELKSNFRGADEARKLLEETGGG